MPFIITTLEALVGEGEHTNGHKVDGKTGAHEIVMGSVTREGVNEERDPLGVVSPKLEAEAAAPEVAGRGDVGKDVWGDCESEEWAGLGLE